MSNVALRYKRLLALLPRVYAVQSEDSYILRLLAIMAKALGDYDDALRRVLYDRWLMLATGKRPEDATLSALGHLGSLLNIYRLPPRIEHSGTTEEASSPLKLTVSFKSAEQRRDALYSLIGMTNASTQEKERLAALFPSLEFEVDSDYLRVTLKANPPGDQEAQQADDALNTFRSMLEWEPSELYRQRLHITAGVLTRGLVTPRAILSLVIADAGAWPCPKITQNAVSEAARRLGIPADTHTAYGIKPAQARQCIACGDPKQKECRFASGEQKEHRIIEAQLVENPVLSAEKHFSGNTSSQPLLTLYNDSLWPDRPVFELTLLEALPKGTTLQITSKMTEEELIIGSSNDWRTDTPDTQLKVFPQLSSDELVPFESGEKVSHHAWDTSQGEALCKQGAAGSYQPIDKATHFHFKDGLHTLKDGLQTPLLRSGKNTWEITAKDTTGKAVSLSFALHLRWFIRRPFHFRLSLPKTDALKQAEMRGALSLIKQDLERIRAVGVRADLRFPDAPRREEHALSDTLQAVEFTLRVDDLQLQETENPLSLTTKVYWKEQHDQSEGTLWITAIFADDKGEGGTFFDQSLLADEPPVSSRFGEPHDTLGKARFA